MLIICAASCQSLSAGRLIICRAGKEQEGNRSKQFSCRPEVSPSRAAAWYFSHRSSVPTSSNRNLLVLDFLNILIRKSLSGEKSSLFCTISQIALSRHLSSSTCRMKKRLSSLFRSGPVWVLRPGLL